MCNAGDVGWISGWDDLPEEEMISYSCILAWEIPWTEEPGGIQSMALQSQTHLATQQRTAAQVEQSHYITSHILGRNPI